MLGPYSNAGIFLITQTGVLCLLHHILAAGFYDAYNLRAKTGRALLFQFPPLHSSNGIQAYPNRGEYHVPANGLYLRPETNMQFGSHYVDTKNPLPRLLARCHQRQRPLPLGLQRPLQASSRRAPSRAALAAAAPSAAPGSAAGGTRCEGSAVARGACRSQSINRRHFLQRL